MPSPPTTSSFRIILVAVAFALIGGVAYGVCRIPVQVSDSVGNLLQIQHQSLPDLFISQFSNGAYIRPLLWVQFKLGYILAAGHEQLLFKSIHVAQILLLGWLFVRPMQVRTGADLTAALLAVLVLLGMHTFDGMVREAFPINAFLTVALCVLAAINLSLGEHHRWHDLAVAGLFCFAILTVESGILVLPAVVAARLVGLKGVSWKGVALTGGAFAGYLALRFAVLGTGGPGLGERASGFGFQILEPRQLIERFEGHATPFYAYNVVASLVSVLLAEPRGGVWWAAHGLWNGDLLPSWLSINIAASVTATVMCGIAAVLSLGRWRAGQAQARERLVLIGLAVLAANALVSFSYTKDVIMSTGGVCFALATYAATAMLLAETSQGRRRRWAYAAVALGLCLWTVRAVALPHRLSMQIGVVRAEWLDVYPWLERQQIHLTSPEAHALVERLRGHALRADPPTFEWTGWRRILDLN